MARFALADFSGAEWSVLLPGLAIVVAVSIWLSIIDWREHRLPNNIVGPLAAGVVVWLVVLGVVADDGARLLNAVGFGLAAFAVFFVLNLVAGVGMGDVKYSFPVAATVGWFGWGSLRLGLLAMIVSAGVVAILAIVSGRGRDHRVAFGPYMAFGLVCGIAHGLIG